MFDRATIRLHAIALAAASWLVLAWTQAVPGPLDRFGTLRGVDFVQFYAAGWTVARRQVESLYDWEAFERLLPALVPGVGDTLYLPVYPPQVALLFAPFARLSFAGALAVWTVASAVLYVLGAAALFGRLPALRRYRLEFWCAVLGFTPFLQLIAHGQISALALPLMVAALAGFQRGQPLMAGLALGSLVFKPQLGTLALAALLLWPSIRLAVGLATAAAVQAALVWLLLGSAPIVEYLGVASRVAAMAGQFEPKLWAMHNLRAAWQLLLGSGGVSMAAWLISLLAAAWWALRAWRRNPEPEVRFAITSLLGLAANPHLYIYDLVLLTPALACLAAWCIRHPHREQHRAPRLVYALAWLPLIGPLAAVTHVQLTAPVMLAVLWHLALQRDNTPQVSSE